MMWHPHILLLDTMLVGDSSGASASIRMTYLGRFMSDETQRYDNIVKIALWRFGRAESILNLTLYSEFIINIDVTIVIFTPGVCWDSGLLGSDPLFQYKT